MYILLAIPKKHQLKFPSLSSSLESNKSTYENYKNLASKWSCLTNLAITKQTRLELFLHYGRILYRIKKNCKLGLFLLQLLEKVNLLLLKLLCMMSEFLQQLLTWPNLASSLLSYSSNVLAKLSPPKDLKIGLPNSAKIYSHQPLNSLVNKPLFS